MKFDKDVNVNLYAKTDVAKVSGTAVSTVDQAVTFANGQSVSIAKNNNQYSKDKWIDGFYLTDRCRPLAKVYNENDPNGIYGAEQTTYSSGENAEKSGYDIYKLVYNDTYKAAYFQASRDEVFVEEDNLASSGYTLLGSELDECYLDLNMK